MALLKFSEAARAAGVSRAGLYHLVNKGALSVQDTPQGRRIDTAELMRCCGNLRSAGEVSQDVRADVQADVHGRPEVSELLRGTIARLEQEAERLRADLEAERQEGREAERLHREERERLQTQIGRALLLLPGPQAPQSTARRRRKPQKRRTGAAAGKPAPGRQRGRRRPPRRPRRLAGRVLEAVVALTGAAPPGRQRGL